jgi:TPP-dependent pyruvate/acetoin dehydrogenase alpha subunit
LCRVGIRLGSQPGSSQPVSRPLPQS